MPAVADFKTFLQLWHEDRQRARTDLLYLCNDVLGYPDVSREVHGPILDALQHFPGAIEHHRDERDFIAAQQGKVLWEPKCRMEWLPPNKGFSQSRDTQYLYPRGHLKSTVITIAHSIQWMINYPNVRILLTTATELLGQGFIIEIRNHFIQNEALRFLFPDICPQAKDGKVPELGNLGGFTLPCRDNTNKKLGPGGKEPTLQASTVGSSITGYHGDVQKNDDLVEKINSSSQNGIDDVIRHFGSLWDLLEKYNARSEGESLHGWQDTVGTPWDFSDLYQVRRNQQEELAQKGLPGTVNLVIRSAAPNWPDGPFLWPNRVGLKALKAIEDDPTKGPSQLSSQYLMNPIVLGQGLIDDIKGLWWMPREEMAAKLPAALVRGRLDLAGMDNGTAKGVDNDFNCLTVAGFVDGTLLVPWMKYARVPVEQVVEWIFEAFRDFPQMVELTVENASGANPLRSWLNREMSVRGWLPVRFVPRTNKESKKNRIKSLRPWFENRRIALSTALAHRTAIENEIKGFPKYRHDDFLDTLADHMLDAKGEVSGNVLTDPLPTFATSTGRDNIALLLAQAAFDSHGAEGFDRDTGFPT